MKPRQAFTLIELLVVIAIIALLVGMMLPALGAARRNAGAVQCGTQVRQVSNAQYAHAAEHNDWFVHGSSLPGLGGVTAWTIWQSGGPSETDGWIGVGLLWQQRYLDDLHIAWCPLWTPPAYQFEGATYGFAVSPGSAPGHGNKVAWSYHYRSAMDSDDGEGRPPRIDDDDAGDPYIADGFTAVPGEAFGATGGGGAGKDYAHGNGFNVGYLDGSVTNLVDRNDVVTESAPGAANHEGQESDVWEPYFERDSDYFLGGPNAGAFGSDDGHGEDE